MSNKQKLNYRVTVDGKPAFISYDFHELGVIVKDGHIAAESKNATLCNNLITRTYEVRDQVKGSLFPKFKGFAPLFYSGRIELQPYDAETGAPV